MKFIPLNLTLKKCKICGKESTDISEKMGVCIQCLKDDFEHANKIVTAVRAVIREKYSLQQFVPKTKGGLSCSDCVNNCTIGNNEFGFCMLVKNSDGKLIRLTGDEHTGLFSFYYDSLPTNCVAKSFCPGCTSSGYPKYTYVNGPEYGWNNLAVFYQACTYDCLFCQNYHFRLAVHTSKPTPPQILVKSIQKTTSCICFFGGDPAAQIKHSNEVARQALAKAKDEKRIIRVCWETNGSTRPSLMKQTTEYALSSGGTIKIDLKAFDETLNFALCGSSNKFTLFNIKEISTRIDERPEVPLLVISTLLLPGYVDVEQVRKIARFLVEINPLIPYSLLAFYPTFVLDDLPTTSKEHAERCFNIAKEEGLVNVSIGNKHLLR